MKSNLVVIGKFKYAGHLMPRGIETLVRHWPCADEADAHKIVRYHMQQTGALGVECVITTEEDYNETTRSTINE